MKKNSMQSVTHVLQSCLVVPAAAAVCTGVEGQVQSRVFSSDESSQPDFYVVSTGPAACATLGDVVVGGACRLSCTVPGDVFLFMQRDFNLVLGNATDSSNGGVTCGYQFAGAGNLTTNGCVLQAVPICCAPGFRPKK